MTPEDAEALIEFQAAQQEKPTDDSHETEPGPRLSPRIYVTDLASHQRGITHGLWIDANQQPDELDADIAAMLDSSPTLPGLPWDKAWTVGATEDFAGLDLHGFTDTPLITKLAKGVADFGPAYAVYVSLVGTDDRELLDKFEDLYIGSYDSAEAWMREVADDLGWQKQRERITDPLLAPYVTLDYAAMAEDAAQSWDTVTGIDGRLYVFMR
jgi:antirestriction protein